MRLILLASFLIFEAKYTIFEENEPKLFYLFTCLKKKTPKKHELNSKLT